MTSAPRNPTNVSHPARALPPTASLEALASALPELVRDLRGAGFEAGPDQYLNALDLLSYLYLNPQAPSQAQVRGGLAGIFCTRAEEQARFAALFNDWLERTAPSTASSVQDEALPAKPQRKPLTWPERYHQSAFARALPALMATGLVVLMLAIVFWSEPELSVLVGPTPTDTTTQGSDGGTPPIKPTPTTFMPPARQPNPEPAPLPAFYPVWTIGLRLLWLVPVALWVAWLTRLVVLQSAVLRREQAGDRVLGLDALDVRVPDLKLYDAPALEPVWRSLREFRARPTHRLDVPGTVRNLLSNGGFFEPRFRERQVSIAHVALIDRHHRDDHVAELASAWVAAMRREHVQVVDLHYRHDPRHARASHALEQVHNPNSLASLYTDHDLMLLGEGRGLLAQSRNNHEEHRTAERAGYRREIARWVRGFARWPRKWLLTPVPLWPRITEYEAIEQVGFRIAALTTAAISKLRDPRVTLAEDETLDLPVPALLADEPLFWVQERGMSRKRARAAVDAVRSYLGAEGLLLFAGAASYPEVRWPLTCALDLQLGLDATERELRLRKLARLPWFRAAYIPDAIRYAVFERMDADALQRLAGAFQSLFEHRGDKPLRLPYAVPDWQHHGSETITATRTATPGSALADPVLASVIRGRRPKPLEFALPRALFPHTLGEDWKGLWRPLIAGALLVPAALWLNLWLWQGYAETWSLTHARDAMRTASASTTVNVEFATGLQGYANNLAAELRNRGFGTVSVDPLPPSPVPSESSAEGSPGTTDASATPIQIGANVNTDVKDNALAAYRYVLYEPSPVPTPLTSGNTNAIRISVTKAPRVFRDEAQSLERTPKPDLVRIPGGCFQMGSPQTEPERDSDETLHRVCVDDFLIGRYEVTFTEYDAFAEATGREKPNDQGWGRGRRPVINVSWNDAVAYTTWLSEQTGETYRLPTEAEWEYAARAGTETPFWFGATIDPSKANYDGTIAYNNGATGEYRGQTIEVGQFEANPYGLYDVHGNVWEWTCSAYDREYSGAEQHCAEAGSSRTRVLRGGSWNFEPKGLRSAYRVSNVGAGRSLNVGFRVARAIR